jgi:processive rubber oxygenase RoxA-like protein/cytochrome c
MTMSIHFKLRLGGLALIAAGAWTCGRAPESEVVENPEYTAAAGRASAGLVAPLRNDTGDQIVSWVDGQAVTDWTSEITKRERAIEGYLNDTDPGRAETYGFRSGQNPQLAWSWFRDNPVGFNGVPFVLFKTILDLDPDHEHPTLRAIARIWKREAVVPAGTGSPESRWTFDHIGIGPNPSDYLDGVARPVAERQSPLPFGFVFENARAFEPLSAAETTIYDGRLLARRVFQNTSLLIAKLRTTDTEENWERDRPGFGSPGAMDRVFFSCAACHVGRVMVAGRMKFLPGMPNTEIEAQYFSKLLMLTSAALVESGFDPASTAPVNPASIRPNTSAVRALYTEMLDKARQRPQTLYGSSPSQIARGKIQTLAVADQFPSVMQDLIAVGVKTHFIYYVVAKSNAYKQPLPDVLEDRPGQMDAFGIASGLVAIHTRRPDNSFLEFVRRDNPKSPFFSGFSKANGLPVDVPGLAEPVTDAKVAADRIFKSIPAWAPPVPAPIDVKSVNWATDRYHANWDGNQGASSRTLASGASATGDPRMVNVRIHEPLNPFIDNLPPPPYPFPSVDLARAREGKQLFQANCAGCHRSRNETIYPASKLGVDANRTLVNTSVSRFGLAALVMEACRIYGLNNQGQPGAEWCVPEGDWQARLDEYFRDTPRRVAEGANGYKADMLHGIWAQAPYLHNGSVPTLGQLMCPATRPRRFLRGNLNFDETLVGFEWADRPSVRYGPHDTILVKEYDTALPGKSNAGHTFGADMCPDTSGLDPTADRKTIAERVQNSPVGALLAYLKTL